MYKTPRASHVKRSLSAHRHMQQKLHGMNVEALRTICCLSLASPQSLPQGPPERERWADAAASPQPVPTHAGTAHARGWGTRWSKALHLCCPRDPFAARYICHWTGLTIASVLGTITDCSFLSLTLTAPRKELLTRMTK